MADFEFKFQSTVKTLSILGKEYRIDIGNAELIKAWSARSDELARQVESMDDKNIDAMVSMCKSIVDLLLDNDFDRIWEESGHNIYSMFDLISKLSKFINQTRDTRLKEYGL